MENHSLFLGNGLHYLLAIDMSNLQLAYLQQKLVHSILLIQTASLHALMQGADEQQGYEADIFV